LSKHETPAQPGFDDETLGGRYGRQAVERLKAAFARSANPMLIVDDLRLCVTANDAACAMFHIAKDEVPWSRLDDFASPFERARLESQWDNFLLEGSAEGWYQLHADEEIVPLEFSATAAVMPGRNLTVFLAPDRNADQADLVQKADAGWAPVPPASGVHERLSARERQVITLVASGHQTTLIADRLFLSSETIKSHVRNAMAKLGAHTRAHAVAIALVTGEITWDAG
jgi:DNA-binding CsgD family transcriptional regulator